MNSQRFLLAGIIGGILFFLLGWLFYGTLFKDFFASNAGTATGVTKADSEFIWWSLGLGNLVMGFLLAYILGKANVTSVGAGATTGFVAGLLLSLGLRLIFYGTSNLMNLQSVGVGAAIGAVEWAVAGAGVAWVYGMRKAPAPTAA